MLATFYTLSFLDCIREATHLPTLLTLLTLLTYSSIHAIHAIHATPAAHLHQPTQLTIYIYIYIHIYSGRARGASHDDEARCKEAAPASAARQSPGKLN